MNGPCFPLAKVRLLIMVATVFVFAGPAFARIGETKDQIDARYGAPTKTEHATYHGFTVDSETHSFQGFEIVVRFLDGVSESESFKHEPTVEQQHSSDPLERMNRTPLSPQEIKFFLNVNAGSGAWQTASPSHPGWFAWNRDDHTMSAYLVPSADIVGHLMIESAKYVARVEGKKDETKGF